MGRALGLAVIGMALAVAASGSAFAVDPAVVATAPSGAGAPALASTPKSSAPPANDPTGSQIAAWTASDDDGSGLASDAPPPRAIHGEVGAGVGSGGYRNVYGVADIPVGQSSDLVVAASNTSGQIRGGRYGGSYGYGGGALALGFYSNGAPVGSPGCERQPWGPTSASPDAGGCGGAFAP